MIYNFIVPHSFEVMQCHDAMLQSIPFQQQLGDGNSSLVEA
jgi:hypothetical protein